MNAEVANLELFRLQERAKRAGMEDWEFASKSELETYLERVGWTAELARKGDKNTLPGDERNVLYALRNAPALAGLVAFNEFSLRVELTRSPPWRDASQGDEWIDTDDTACQSWLQEQGIAVRSKGAVADCIALAARDNARHPVREYLKSLKWDGQKRIGRWLLDYLHAKGHEAYLTAVASCWLISAVARIMKPGCKADYVLVLESGQGLKKSMLAALLSVKPEWFCDAIGDLRNKDSAIQLCGRWIVELAELNSIRGSAQVEAVKAYLTRTHDVFRPPYGRRAITTPRQCVFLGTTNERQYLRDRTGNRRFWPVTCTHIDLQALERDRDQLWAEAVHAYEAGEQWWLSPDLEALASAEQDERLYRSEIDEMVAEYLGRRADDGQMEVTTRDVFVHALGLEPDSRHYANETKKLGHDVAAAIESAGWRRAGRQGKDRRTVYRLQGDNGEHGASVETPQSPRNQEGDKSRHGSQHPLRTRAGITGESTLNTMSTHVTPCEFCGSPDSSECGCYKPAEGLAL